MATRRYGKSVDSIETAWELLWVTIFHNHQINKEPTIVNFISNLDVGLQLH